MPACCRIEVFWGRLRLDRLRVMSHFALQMRLKLHSPWHSGVPTKYHAVWAQSCRLKPVSRRLDPSCNRLHQPRPSETYVCAASIQAFKRLSMRAFQRSVILPHVCLEVEVKVHGQSDPTFGPFCGAAYNSAKMTGHPIPTGEWSLIQVTGNTAELLHSTP